MANRLKMATVQSILSLHARGWSQRRIARELGVNRESVSRHLRLARQAAPTARSDRVSAKPANAPICSPGTEASNPAHAPMAPAESADSKPANAPIFGPGSVASDPANAPIMAAGSTTVEPLAVAASGAAADGRQSDCEPWRALIQAKQAAGLSARRIYQDLVAEHAAEVSYDSVRRFLRRLGWTRPLPFRRMECAAGQEAQVDFGTGAPIVGADGKRRRTHVFRIVLSHSRKAYSEATYRQTTDDFLNALENAFHHFGGVPQTIVIDNLKAAVKHPDWFDPELVPKAAAFASHYGTVILPTKPYTPRHKDHASSCTSFVRWMMTGVNGVRFERFCPCCLTGPSCSTGSNRYCSLAL
jgi:transposase